jgi:predicted nucleic acid-binding protein
LSGVLLDTDILIEVLRERDDALVARWKWLTAGPERIFYTAINVAELWQGMRAREEEGVLKLLRTLTCIPVTFEIGRRAGDYARRYGPSHGLDLEDALIAATAVEQGCALWTRNRKHYPMKDIELF